MTASRFAAWVSQDRPFSRETVVEFAEHARGSDLEIVRTPPHLLLAATPGAAASSDCASGGAAALVGASFPNGSPDPLRPAEALGALGGAATTGTIFDRIWGSYVLFRYHGADGPWEIIKSPFGHLPCLWERRGDGIACASSLALLRSFGLATPSVDWRETLLYLMATELRRGSTCLEGVFELPGGHGLQLRQSRSVVAPLWSPWRFVSGPDPLTHADEAAELIAAAIDLAVAAQTSITKPSVLLLSGGLDSSVVAAALVRAGRPFAALNMVTRERSGDERVYARAMAQRAGAPLTETLRSSAAIDWADRTPSRLPRPSARVFRQPALNAARALARSTGADTVLDGGGGDNVFCSLQSVAPVLDRLHCEGLRAAWSTARDIALLCDVGRPTVAKRAVLRLLSRRVRFRWLLDHTFLVADAQSFSAHAATHPWLAPPRGALPGQAAHVALALAAASVAESLDGEDAVPIVSPLVAQPVVEAALRVRSWLWFADGHNRMVVRRGFGGRVPETILLRQGKGTPAGFMAEIVERERPRLRELLLDGLIVRNDIADRRALEAYLGRSAPPHDYGFARVLQLADAELWARSWN